MNAPEALGPWDTLFFAFNSVKQTFVENRPFTEPRQRVIASSPALQERATAKTRSLTAAVASALCERGLTAPQANLAAQMGMATLSHGVAAWFNDGSIDLGEHIVRAFQEARDLSSSNLAIARENGEPNAFRKRQDCLELDAVSIGSLSITEISNVKSFGRTAAQAFSADTGQTNNPRNFAPAHRELFRRASLVPHL